MEKRNNLILILVLALVGFGCSVPVEWFTIVNATSSDGGTIPSLVATGISGKVDFFNVWTPIWLLVVISGLGLLVDFANLLGVTSIPRLLPMVLLLGPGAYYGMVFMLPHIVGGNQHVTISIGVYLAAIASVIAVAVTVMSGRQKSG